MHTNINNKNTTVKKIKLVLLGNSAVGKTCIVQRMIYDTFSVNNTSTIGAAFTCYNVEKNIRIEMWDTAGQERFHSLLPMYARGAEIILVVIDIEKNMDEQVLKWNKYIKENENLFSPHFKLFLIFNKYDANPNIEIPETIMSETTQFSFVILVSAKTAHNIDKLKTYLDVSAKKIVDECARASHDHDNAMRRNSYCGITNHNNHNNNNNNNRLNTGNNSNIGNNENDTMFGSTFSNLNINIGFQEYRGKMKKYYEKSSC